MRILVTGAKGLLGRRLVPALGALGHDVLAWDIDELDITDFAATAVAIHEAAPEQVIHCAAMTQVDKCAEQPDLALRINGYGTQNIAAACQRCGAALAYISTNEVFDGERAEPYLEYDPTHPINPYAYSKWVGEQAIRDLVPRHQIIRTSWLFGHGGANFLQRILELARQGKPLQVVTNEVAAPTYAEDLVEAIARLIAAGRPGIYHLVNEGRASRYAFARHILDRSGFAEVPIQPIVSAQRPRPSQPPPYSVLRNFAAAQLGITLPPWQEAVDAYFERERQHAGQP